MDLAFGDHSLFCILKHTTRDDASKILRECTYPLTAPACVDLIITDIGIIEVTPDGLLSRETAPGWTAEDVQALTEPKLTVAADLKTMAL